MRHRSATVTDPSLARLHKKRRGHPRRFLFVFSQTADQGFLAHALHQPFAATLFFGKIWQGPVAAPAAPL